MRRAPHEFIRAEQGIPAESGSGGVNGAAIDCAGFEDALISLSAGTVGGDLDVSVEDSPDGTSGWAPVTGAAIPTVTAPGPYVMAVRLRNTNRYIRVVANAAGASVYSVDVLLTNPEVWPVTQENTPTAANYPS